LPAVSEGPRNLFGEPIPEAPDAARRGKGRRRKGRREEHVVRGKVKVHDPFELVRWLALSQPDPRKALAELVQNSLDAGARSIRVTRVRERKVPCLRILDDGEGVIPELDRPEALRHVATHIGHSRKRSLSPEERLRLMTQGQYGIGLLGFWSLGDALEMRSAVPGQEPHRLILYRDRPDFRIEPLSRRGLFEDRWTEVVVVGLHKEALGVLVARRAADYLAGELRGQLLGRKVDLLIEDRMARGRAEKLVPVRPRRFLGERIAGLDRLEVPGLPPIQLEVHLQDEDGGGAEPLAVYAAGTLVAESFHELAALGLERRPWTDPRVAGMIDFPGFTVAPGSRRGVVPDEAAGAFARALRTAEPVLREALDRLEQRRVEEIDRKLVRDLQRAFRGFFRQQPSYTLLDVQADGDRGEGPKGGDGASGETFGAAEGVAVERQPSPGPEVSEPPAELPFPPGPLESVELRPATVRLSLGAARRIEARPLDRHGRPAQGPVTCHWRLDGDAATLADLIDGEPRVTVRAGERTGRAVLRVVAHSFDGLEAEAEAAVEVTDEAGRGRSDEGIPEPELVDHPGAPWRSRYLDGRWQVNSAHREYRAIRDKPALKVRYLAMLFAKEVVLRSTQDPRLEKPLEQLVEIAAYADRNLAGKGRRKG
jgi:hypothetical protein